MPAKKVQVFNDTELMDDAAAEATELGQGEPVEQPTEPDSTGQPTESAPSATPADTPPQTQAERTIPYSRFQEVVNARNAERQELQQLRERWARIDERQKQAKEARDEAERQAAAQRQAAERPDPAIDPVGAQLYDITQSNRQLQERLGQYEQRFTQLSQGYQQDQQTNQFNNWVVAQAQDYARQQPDYFDAAQHAANWRVGFWEKLGLPNEQARQLVMAESNLLANISRQTGKPFPAIVYDLAKSVGYQPHVANGNGNGNGASQPNAQAASQAGKILSQVAAGQKVQGLSRAGGAESGAKSRYGMMTAAEIANVDERTWQRDWNNPQLRPEMQAALRRLDGLESEDINYDIRR